MDLSFSRFDREAESAPSPADLDVLLVGVAARQAASRTAGLQTELARGEGPRSRFAPRHGRFNPEAAAALAEWKAE